MKKMLMMIVVVLIAGQLGAAKSPVNTKEAKEWKRYCLPLPQKIDIKEKTIIRPSDLGIIHAGEGGKIVQTGIKDFKEFYKHESGVGPTGNKFKIVLEVLSKEKTDQNANFAKLANCPNNDQAYIIVPHGENGLLVAALSEKGIYYGLATLKQLLKKDISKDRIAVPLLTVLDWPDFDQRGLWNGGFVRTNSQVIPWLADMKLNFINDFYVCRYCWKKDKKNGKVKITTTFAKDSYNKAASRAMIWTGRLGHRNFWPRIGFKDCYPELQGKGDSAKQDCVKMEIDRCPCVANPKLTVVTADLMREVAKHGFKDLSCWVSEYACNCSCDECNKLLPELTGRERQLCLEIKSYIDAWKIVKKDYPDLKIRVFTSFNPGGNEAMKKALDNAEIPKEVGIEPCCSGVVNMPVFNDYAANGYSIYNYGLGLGPFPTRFHVLRKKDRLKNLYDRKLSGAYAWSWLSGTEAYEKFGNPLISAIAEWSWNLNGRGLKEFGEAWAIKNGVKDPEKFTDWLVAVSPVETNMYVSVNSVKRWMKEIIEQVKNKKTIKTNEYKRKIAECRRALKIAEELNRNDMVMETKLVISFLEQYQLGMEITGYALIKNSQERKKALEKSVQQLESLLTEREKTVNEIADSWPKKSARIVNRRKKGYSYVKVMKMFKEELK